MAFHSYMLGCYDASYYKGHTDNIEARLYAHQNGVQKGCTSSRRRVHRVWCEVYATRDEAFTNEWMIKGWRRSKKDALVAGDWQELTGRASFRAATRATSRLAEQTALVTPKAHPTSTSG